MWNFRSILDYQKYLENYPLLQDRLNEAQELWQLCYTSKDSVYYMLALVIGVSAMSLAWIKDASLDLFSYQEQQEFLALKLQEKPVAMAQLGASRLFGSPLVEQGTLSVSYKLQGIVYDDVPDHSQVILKDDSGHTGSYHIGDDLPEGGRVTAIKKNEIEIEADGVRQKLKLDEYPATFLSDDPLELKKSIFDDAN